MDLEKKTKLKNNETDYKLYILYRLFFKLYFKFLYKHAIINDVFHILIPSIYYKVSID